MFNQITDRPPVQNVQQYKESEKKVFALLDPDHELRGTTLSQATKIALRRATKLEGPARDIVFLEISKSIKLRKKEAQRCWSKPELARKNHEKYIQFLLGIQQVISPNKNTSQEQPELTQPELTQPEMTQPGLTQPELTQPELTQPELTQPELTQPEETQPGGQVDRDGETDLTLDQVNFLASLEYIMALVRKAADFWKDVAQNKLPIWTASTMSSMYMREVESFIEATRLLDEEDRLEGSPRIWCSTLEKPQLSQGWIDALPQARDQETLCELKKLVPEVWRYIELFVLPCLTAAGNIFTSAQPYAFQMLPFDTDTSHSTVAEVPLVALMAAYFCRLVTSENFDLDNERVAARNKLNEAISVIPRLFMDGTFTIAELESYRDMAKKLTAWIHACREPMSLGAVQAVVRVQWVKNMRLVASNSIPLQLFIYLLEKRRLETFKQEPLIRSLLTDERIAPHLLEEGRPPESIEKCMKGLQRWCLMRTSDGETREPPQRDGKNLVRLPMVEHSSNTRNSTLLTENMIGRYARPLTKGLEDDASLKNCLNRELDPPGCQNLEVILFDAIKKTPEWKDLLAATGGVNFYARASACIEYLLPTKNDQDPPKMRRNEVIGCLLGVFMEEARPVLETAYGCA